MSRYRRSRVRVPALCPDITRRRARSMVLMGAIIWLVVCGVAGPQRASGSPPTEEEIKRWKEDGTFADRLSRLRRLSHDKIGEDLAPRVAYKLRLEALRAAKLSPAQITRQMFGPRLFQFPYQGQPELKASGTQKTLTVLVDFADHRAETELPGVTQSGVQQNIYGAGPPAEGNPSPFTPFESVHAFYHRASETKLDLQGNVIGFYHFPKNRDEYRPNVANMSEDEKWAAEKSAIHAMCMEALTALGVNEDLAQYDNDHDGYVDCITMLYTGPHPSDNWGTFWWAYQWNFALPDEAPPTDGPRRALHKFIFCPIDTWDNGEFKPLTLIHEMGHALGLPDYYHYADGDGPGGGLGGLDIMDDKWGNHNAFSRWLLDWIEPEVIGDGPPLPRTLVASGSTLGGNKAIAIFPGLSKGASAPRNELFMIENRFQTGNDGGSASTPNSGLLIWHIDASTNYDNDNFLFDNAQTTPKLIRLVRADSAADFSSCNQWASATTYFNAKNSFNAYSVPSSRSYMGWPTNVYVGQISPPGETMTVTVGFGFPDDNAPAPNEPPPSSPADLSSTREKPEEVVNLAGLDRAWEKYRAATSAEMKVAWNASRSRAVAEQERRREEIDQQLILTQWARKDGLAACQAALTLPPGDFAQEAFARVMETWANHHPPSAARWYFDSDHLKMLENRKLAAGDKFASAVFFWWGRHNLNEAVTRLDQTRIPELGGALDGLGQMALKGKLAPSILAEKLATLKNNRLFVEAINHPERAGSLPGNADEKRQLREVLTQRQAR